MFSQNVLIFGVLEPQAINYILFGSILSRQIPQVKKEIIEHYLPLWSYFTVQYGDSG